MTLKSYGGKFGIWVGAGTQSQKTPFVTKTWLKTVYPPYMSGVGLAFGRRKYSIRIGVYKVIARYVSDDYDDIDVEGELAVLGWGLEDERPEVIGTWGSTPSESTTSEPLESKALPTQPPAAPETALGSSTSTPSSTGPSPSP